ncbi:tyrosine-type recombinase/integrase [Pectinatus brassicae]|nr:site-specific integrase [Pectinatus brassicae]
MPSKKKQANGNGSIYFDKTRQRYWAGIVTPEGKRVGKRFKTMSEAIAWKNEQLTEINQGEFVEPSSVTVGEWSIEWLMTYKKDTLKQRTYERYLSLLKHLQQISGYKLQDLQPVHVQKLYKNLPTLSACTINKVHKVLKAMMTKAYDLGMIKKNIMTMVSPPRFEKKEIEIFTPAEIERILTTCLHTKKLERYYPTILLTATTGIRIGEALGLRWCDINFTANEIFIKHSLQESLELGAYLETPKTKAGVRKIKLTDDVISVLKHLKLSAPALDIKQEQFILTTRNNTPVKPNNFTRAWRYLLKLADVPYRNFHVLRHTHATELLAAGVPIVEVSRRLGHSKITHTLELYGHAIPNYENEIAAKVKNLYIIPK